MSISSITSGSNVNVSTISRATARVQGSDDSGSDRAGTTQDSFQSDFGSLLKAIQSGDLATAQTALSSLKTDVGSSATYSPSSTTSSASSGIDSDLKSMFDAVSSGDISGAQSALTNFKSDVKAAAPQGGAQRAHGHHGHHGPKGPPPASADTDSDSTSTDSTSTDSTSADSTSVNASTTRRNHGLESVIASLFDSTTTDSTGSETATTSL